LQIIAIIIIIVTAIIIIPMTASVLSMYDEICGSYCNGLLRIWIEEGVCLSDRVIDTGDIARIEYSMEKITGILKARKDSSQWSHEEINTAIRLLLLFMSIKLQIVENQGKTTEFNVDTDSGGVGLLFNTTARILNGSKRKIHTSFA
jgi:hypothetical protein